MRQSRLRPSLFMLPVLCFGLFTACSNSLMMEQFIPWYSSLTQRAIDFSAYLPAEYRGNSIVIRGLSGPDPAAPTSATKDWIVFFQDRNPEASEVVVLNPDYSVAYQTTSVVAGAEAGKWLVDAAGRILLGGLMIMPPAVPGAAWTKDYSPAIFRNFNGSVVVTIPGSPAGTSRHYRVDFRFDPATDTLAFGNSWDSNRLYAGDHTWTTTGSVTGQSLVSGFAASYHAKLFGGVAWTPGTPMEPVVCHWAQADGIAKRLYLYCTWYDQKLSPVFVISLPMANLETIAPSDVSVTILETGASAGADGYANNGYDIYSNQGVTRAGGGYLLSLPSAQSSGGGGKRNPLVYNKSDGSLGRRVEYLAPSYGSGSSTAGNSSIGQQAFLIPNAKAWLAIDGFTQKLYVCSPWWE